MKAISFELSGKSACFRKPDVNQFVYFTYNNIHKPALLGLLGAILGYGGYTQLYDKNRDLRKGQLGYNDGYPEFYENLKKLKISIIPLTPHGYFSKKIQVFNNSVGYANAVGAKPEERRKSSNLVVREQWLENPIWQVLVLDDTSNEYEQLKRYLLNKKSIFIPYLGKNDHPAKIDKVEIVELENRIDDAKISSLFIEKNCEVFGGKPRGELSYFFREVSPIRLQKEYHFYKYENLLFTNHKVISVKHKDIYSYDNQNYFFL